MKGQRDEKGIGNGIRRDFGERCKNLLKQHKWGYETDYLDKKKKKMKVGTLEQRNSAISEKVAQPT